MMKKHMTYAATASILTAAIALTGCGGANNVQTGTIAGSVVGGVVGHQFGKGDGKKAATVAGAIAGGVIGGNIARNQQNQVTYYNNGTHRHTDGVIHGGHRHY